MKKFVLGLSMVSLCIFSVQAEMNLQQKGWMKKQEEAIKSESARFEKECGCTPKVTVDWASYSTQDEFLKPKNTVRNLAEAMGNLCKKGFKGEVCGQVKELKVSIAQNRQPAHAFSAGVVSVATTDKSPGASAQGLQKLLEENLK